MRRFLRSIALAAIMLTLLAGSAAAYHGEPRSPDQRDCVGAHISALAHDGLVGGNASEFGSTLGSGFGLLISGIATTCEFPPPE
jgi:hypothetical protein